MPSEAERVLSVFELAQGLKRTVESATQGRWVEGEIGRLQRPGSGHLYFTLKDESRDANIDCVMYKRDAMRFSSKLSEGARVQLRGRATFYPPRGRLQWIAEVARPAGQGALLEALERLRKQLIAEGLTDASRRRQLPSQPRTVGVVTSKTGAAFADICTVALRRGNVTLLLAPALVQGEQAPDSLLRALDAMEKAKPDVVIFGRGGGSAEDLMAFNDERVVRRVADFPIPIVSAVGHEIDTSLCDLVADARAATPSEAAEMVVADSRERLHALARVSSHLSHAMRARLTECRLELNGVRSELGDPRFMLADEQQRLDDLRLRLGSQIRRKSSLCRDTLERQGRRLYARHPRAVVADARADLAPLKARLHAASRRRLDADRAQLSEAAHALSHLSPLAILGRGYAIATSKEGQAIVDAAVLSPGDELSIRVDKGSFVAQVRKVTESVEKHSAFAHESALPRGREGESS